MRFIPILFSTPMVKAILDNRKTQTRRVLKSRHESGMFRICRRLSDGQITEINSLNWDHIDCGKDIVCPYGQPGDILWVRERLRQHGELGLEYIAGLEWLSEDIIPHTYPSYRNYAHCNIPSIHMPKWACRLFLQVKSIRVERLQDISEEDAKAEGVDKVGLLYNNYSPLYKQFNIGNLFQSATQSFESLWVSINDHESWGSNPWVWVVEFERIELTPEQKANFLNNKS